MHISFSAFFSDSGNIMTCYHSAYDFIKSVDKVPYHNAFLEFSGIKTQYDFTQTTNMVFHGLTSTDRFFPEL